MKIIITVRTLNEEENIERFCRSYQWADKILVADGGSEDNTVLIAKTFPNVRVQPFLERQELQNGYWRNPGGKHLNFLATWALEEHAHWVLHDDCDSVPNFLLKKDIRWILEDCEYDMLFAVRLYLWGEDRHFPKLAQPAKAGVWETSMYGWRRDVNMRFTSKPNAGGQVFSPKREKDERMNLFPPYCLLHDPWRDEEAINKKLTFYRESGQIEGMLHPTEFGGKPYDLPDWAVEDECSS